MTSTTRSDVMGYLEGANMLEISELITDIEEKFGVTAAAPVAAAAAGPAVAVAVEDEKTEFTVHLVSFGEKKINVIKVVRTLTGLGLKEAKELVDGAPSNIKEGVAKAEAEEMKQKLVEAGATAELT